MFKNNELKKGHKFYKNSNNKSYHEDWEFQKQDNNEILTGKSTDDDGYGNKQHKNYGNCYKNNEKMYEFCDTTEDIATINQKIMTKKGNYYYYL